MSSEDMLSKRETTRRQVTCDLAGLVAISAMLALVHFTIPPLFQQNLAFAHTGSELYTLVTAAYVHSSNGHLFGNLVGFALTAGYTYWLCLAIDGRRWFWWTTAAFLVLLPVLVNVTSWLLFMIQFPGLELTSRGFSGVVAGYGGMLLVALTRFVRMRFNRDLGQVVGISVFLVLMQVIDFRYQSGFSPTVGGLVIIGLGLVSGSYVAQHGVSTSIGTQRRALQNGGVVGLVVVVLTLLILGLFPAAGDLTEGGTLTNVFAHAAGFGWGIILSLGMSALKRTDSRSMKH